MTTATAEEINTNLPMLSAFDAKAVRLDGALRIELSARGLYDAEDAWLLEQNLTGTLGHLADPLSRLGYRVEVSSRADARAIGDGEFETSFALVPQVHIPTGPCLWREDHAIQIVAGVRDELAKAATAPRDEAAFIEALRRAVGADAWRCSGALLALLAHRDVALAALFAPTGDSSVAWSDAARAAVVAVIDRAAALSRGDGARRRIAALVESVIVGRIASQSTAENPGNS